MLTEEKESKKLFGFVCWHEIEDGSVGRVIKLENIS